MILVDTSVWVDHLRTSNATLASLLGAKVVELHPFVFGELSCGQLTDRRETLAMLARIRPAAVVPHGLVARILEHHRLFGSGIGWIDMHILAAALSRGHEVYTYDVALGRAAARVGVQMRT